MILRVLYVLAHFKYSILCYWLSIKSRSKYYYCGKNLLQLSFILPEAAQNDPLIVLKELKRVLLKLYSAHPFDHISDKNSSDFIYEYSFQSKETRKKYIHYFTKQEINNFISKEELIFSTDLFSKAIVSGILVLISLPLLLISLFTKNKASLALILCGIIENSNLLLLVKKHNLKKCYFFSIYQTDANIASLMLMKNDVNVIKIASEVPIALWNKIIIANKLIICNQYQYEEMKHFNESIFIDSTEFWGPEAILDVLPLYEDKNLPTAQNTLGFYSSGSLVRESEGHINQGTSMFKNEHLILSYLKEYSMGKPEIKLIIFLHPKEKTKKYFQLAKKYFGQHLEGMNFEFADIKKKSAEIFNTAEIAISHNSTLMHERLFFGFKSLLMPLDYTYFPLQNSNISNICVFEKVELFNKLNESFSCSAAEFFEKNKLTGYTFWEKNYLYRK